MTTPERILEQTADLIRRVSAETRKHGKRRRRRQRRILLRVVRTGALMALASFVIVIGMISSGLLFGPRGIEGLLATPLLIFASWAAILYWALRRPSAKALPLPAAKTTNLAQLPAETDDWLEHQRMTLPFAAQRQLDAISARLEVLAPQLSALAPDSPAGTEVRRLIGEELPELIRSYQKVPAALQRQPLHGGPSPDRRLLDGLATVDEELGRMHSRLAVDDLHALATQQRYLEIKYKDKLE